MKRPAVGEVCQDALGGLRARPDARPANSTENLSGAFSVRSVDAFSLYQQERVKGLDAIGIERAEVGEPKAGAPLDLSPGRPRGRQPREWRSRWHRAA